MRLPPLEHLVFSTRAARPESGGEYNREVIASSPGVPEAARHAFSSLADLGGALLHARDVPPVHVFSPVDDRGDGAPSWLFCRALSLGRYRKGIHQLLVHGVVLDEAQLDALDGNPFLLTPEAGIGAPFPFLEHHPEGRSRLEPEPVPPGIAGQARGLNEARLALLDDRFRELAAFAELFGHLRRGRRVAHLDDDPRSALVEWLLLHLHPHDRAEVRCHGWYSYDHPVEVDLLLAPAVTAGQLRRHFPDLETTDGDHRPSAGTSGPVAPGPDAPVETLVAALRRVSPRSYLSTVRRYRLSYLSRRAMAPIGDDDAGICLRHALGLPLDAAEEKRRVRLEHRGGTELTAHLLELVDAWRESGYGVFRSRLEKLAGGRQKVDPDQLEDALERVGKSDVETRWALAAALRSALLDDHPAWTGERRRAWRAVLPPERLETLFQRLGGGAREVEHAAAIFEAYLRELAEDAGDAADAAELAAYWQPYLDWLAASPDRFTAAAGLIEELADALPDDLAVVWYRRLAAIAERAGLSVLACRLTLQKETPRLPEEDAYPRLAETAARTLERDDRRGDRLLRSFLGRAQTAPALLIATAGWLLEQSDPARAWKRWQSLWREPEPRLAASTDDVATFVTRLAISPLAGSVAEAATRLARAVAPGKAPQAVRAVDLAAVLAGAAARLERLIRRSSEPGGVEHLGAGIAGLIRARDRHPLPAAAGVDRGLLELIARALVFFDATPAAAAGGETLRAAFGPYLAFLIERGALAAAAGDARGVWRHLLADELLRRPPRHPRDDPYYRAGLILAWGEWQAAQTRSPETGGGDGLSGHTAVARLLTLTAARARATRDWHRAVLVQALPGGDRAAEALLERLVA